MSKPRLVWDLPTRIFHWSFVIAILTAWISIETGREELHTQAGYMVLGLLTFRLLWGLFGTRHARFASFFPSPRAVYRYARSLLGREPEKPYPGHNPLGSLMVLLLLALVAVQAVTGLFTEGDIWSGPYYAAVSKDTAKTLESLHHQNFDFILIAAGLHIVAVFVYLFFKKQNLVRPMVTGTKSPDEVDEAESIPHSGLVRAATLAVVVIAFVYWLVEIAPPVAESSYYYY